MGLRPLPSALTLGAAVLATVLVWEVFTPAPALDGGRVVVEIPAHRGVFGVAATLRDAGVIRSRAATPKTPRWAGISTTTRPPSSAGAGVKTSQTRDRKSGG